MATAPWCAAWAAVVVLLAVAGVPATAKECINQVTASHTVQARLQASSPEWRRWRDEPRAAVAVEHEDLDWAMLYRSLKGQPPLPAAGGGGVAGPFMEEVSLHDVWLDPDGDAVYGRAQRTNLEYLLLLDVDRLVWSFRAQAGLPAPEQPYGGWEGPDVELRGHFVGHYLSATAKMWASTHNATLAGNMEAAVDALHECQRAAGTGYFSAFPAEFFDIFEAVEPIWAPYYTIHKIMQGLLDQHVVAGNGKALGMVVAMADYFAGRVSRVIRRYSIERHWASLKEETGGMNDILYQLYTITNDQRHLVLAHLFDKPCFLGMLALQIDSLSDFHANTHIPVVVGGQMRYEVTGDPLYKEIATFFMDTVNSSHTFATGGTSVGEFWSDPKRLAETLTTETQESCTTYNMLKVSRHLFRWTNEIAYADYYERALINGVLSIQRGRDPGVMIYMLPQGPGSSKARSYHKWGTPYDSFWCCYGTGIESFSKLGDSIYFEEKGEIPAVYIIQFIPSTFNWRTAGLTVTQQLMPLSSSDQYLQALFSISAKTDGQFATLNVRIPSWTSLNGVKATLNNRDLELASPGTFLTISKEWSSGDQLSLQLPIHLLTESIKDDRPEYASIKAVLFGPFLLAGLTTGDWDAKTGGATAAASDWIIPIPPESNSQLLTLVQESGGKAFVLSAVNGSLEMKKRPKHGGGTDAAVHATFRLVPHEAAAGAAAMLEPLDMPGMVVTDKLMVSAEKSSGALFNVVPGLDGATSSVSLELGARMGCFLVGGGGKVHIGCGGGVLEHGGGGARFRRAVSFVRAEPLRRYHPMSFVARGVRRSFLLEPLFTLRDESYTVYFNLVD